MILFWPLKLMSQRGEPVDKASSWKHIYTSSRFHHVNRSTNPISVASSVACDIVGLTKGPVKSASDKPLRVPERERIERTHGRPSC
jgi:hypothetical protein